ncbi:MAG: acyl-CoA desaturase, partial [Candidatus Poseidoniales archaeon]
METSTGESRKWKLDLVNASFLSGIPVLAVIGLVWYSINHGVSFVELSIFGFMYIATGLSITAGYHRLFSHRTHKGAWPLRLFYALFG